MSELLISELAGVNGLTGTETILQLFQEFKIRGGSLGHLLLYVPNFTHSCPVRSCFEVWRDSHDEKLKVLSTQVAEGWGGQEGCLRGGEAPRILKQCSHFHTNFCSETQEYMDIQRQRNLRGKSFLETQDILISVILEKEAKTGKQMYTERQRHTDYKILEIEIHLYGERKAKG